MTPEEVAKMLENFRTAGKAAASVMKQVPKLVLPGESVLDIAETLEKMIADAGAKPAFPANISINDIAAHRPCRFKRRSRELGVVGRTRFHARHRNLH